MLDDQVGQTTGLESNHAALALPLSRFLESNQVWPLPGSPRQRMLAGAICKSMLCWQHGQIKDWIRQKRDDERAGTAKWPFDMASLRLWTVALPTQKPGTLQTDTVEGSNMWLQGQVLLNGTCDGSQAPEATTVTLHCPCIACSKVGEQPMMLSFQSISPAVVRKCICRHCEAAWLWIKTEKEKTSHQETDSKVDDARWQHW